MATQGYEEISREQLEQRLEQADPNNQDPVHGYALVNVLDEDAYEEEHIPDSINIPQGEEEEFEKRFLHGKEIIVYCASHDCPASPKAAKELADRGFRNIKDYAAGMKEWKQAGNPVESGVPS